MKTLLLTAATAALLAGQAAAATVTLTVDGVRNASGQVLANLCADPAAPFPGVCTAAFARAPAVQGRATLVIRDVRPGTYAIQVVHDEDGDGRPEIPPEGYAFGNDTAFPPTFEKASIKVEGDVQTRVNLSYGFTPAARPLGSKGAEPAPGVERIDVREGGLYGAFYLPQGGGKRPALLLLGGSEGGLDTISNLAASFNREGYAVLALAYWGEQGLPQTREMIPLEYFDRAVAWLKGRAETNGRIGVIGWSRGSEAALLLAARNADVRAVAAVAPSSVVWEGLNFADMANPKPAWTVGGEPLPFVEPDASAYAGLQAPMAPMFTRALVQADRRADTAIPVERARGPVLLISGGADNLWPSSTFASRIVARLKGAGFRHPVEHLSYPEAGHVVFVGAPDSAMARWATAPSPMGGTPAANAKAWADDWPKTLAFFNKALKEPAR